jgi:ElaB/YqjD/DUF883 family membrane-anchored ribosome-binding protein
MAESTMNRLGARAAEGFDEAQRTARGELREAANTATEMGREAKGKVEDIVQSNPLMAIGAAAFLGYLVGALGRR